LLSLQALLALLALASNEQRRPGVVRCAGQHLLYGGHAVLRT